MHKYECCTARVLSATIYGIMKYMTLISIDFHVDLEMAGDTPSVLMLEADKYAEQTVTDDALFAPLGTELELFRDLYGNPCRRGILPNGYVGLDYRAVVDTPDCSRVSVPDVGEEEEPARSSLPADVLHFLTASRYCPSDDIESVAADLFGAAVPTTGEKVLLIVEWIHDKVKYAYGTSDTATTAVDTYLSRSGVCRDFAHLAIAFCRAQGIPARYVSGYCLGLETPDLHAYFQAFIGGQWYTFDATSAQSRPALARIGIGRDAADCAWSTFFGSGQTTYMSVKVVDLANQAP